MGFSARTAADQRVKMIPVRLSNFAPLARLLDGPAAPGGVRRAGRHCSNESEGELHMPKYFLSIVEDQGAYAPGGHADFDAVMAAHQDFAEQVGKAGAKLLGGEALQGMSTASFLRGTRTDAVSAVDNPLPDAKEVLGGYYLIEAEDEATALAVAKLCPAPYGYIEVRPIWDFG